jgi:CheY-like chemotaxis protein
MEDAIKLGRSIIPSNIEVLKDIDADCRPVLADPTQLHQIIMNLMINAWHAMEETGGKISIGLTETDTEEGGPEGVSLAPGRYAVMTISDTGCGIEAAVMGRMFEPYFTTKPQGKGTGLGLAVVYGIVREHGGEISVYSKVGEGATFDVYLPLAQGDAENSETAPEKLPGANGDERILFVDDEALIREMGTAMLEHHGYRITACENGAEALKTFSSDPTAFDLVITDMNMPNMTGDRLAEELVAIRPDIPIIICTGFSDRVGREDARAMGVRAFLKKPVSLMEMSREVRRALDGENG